MERDRSRTGESTRRTEERGRWRDAAQREQEDVEQRGESMDRDRMERERMERERTERERMERERGERDRMERDRLQRERTEREARGDLVGRGSGSSSMAMRDPVIASHFDFMRQFMREMSRMFEGWPFSSRSMASPGYASGIASGSGGQSSLTGWPPIEVEERDGRMVVRAELPGIEMQDVRVRLEGNYLLIEGERRDNRERKEQGFYETEWSYGHFSRRIPIPPGVAPDQIRATCENGVLELTMEVPSQNVREIPIRTGRSGRDEPYVDRGRERDRDRDRDEPFRTQH